MGQFNIEKKSFILIFDKAGTLRDTLGASLGEMGYRNILHVKTSEEACRHLAEGNVSWVFSYLYSQDAITGLHIARLALSQSPENAPRVSLFLDDSESELIPMIMTLGVLSVHPSVFTKADLKDHLRALLQGIKHGRDDTLIAAESFRDHLLKSKKYSEIIKLCDLIIPFFPDNVDPYLWQAEAQFALNQQSTGAYTLSRVPNKSPADQQKRDQYALKFLGRPLAAGDSRPPIDSCVVVDSDRASQNQMKVVLGHLGAQNVRCLGSDSEAIEYLIHHQDTQLIITEWKQPTVHGIALVQRVREIGLHRTPIVVSSAQVQEHDQQALQEFDIFSVVKKPLDERQAMAVIIKTINEQRQPHQPTTMMRHLKQSVRMHDLSSASRMYEVICRHSKASASEKLEAQAEYAYLEGKLKLAFSLAIQALKDQGNTLHILSLLGRIAHDQKNYGEALKFLEKAHSMAPYNVERLCMIAKIKSLTGEQQSSEAHLRQALTIDSESVLVKEASLEIIKGSMNHDDIESLLGDASSSASLVSYWNAKAIKAVKAQKIDEAITTYKKALLALPKGMSPNRSTLRYNLALSYARRKKFKMARNYLETLVCEEESPVLEKALSLHQKILDFLSDGTPVMLNTQDFHQSHQDREVLAFEDFDDLYRMERPAGSLGLYKIYYFQGTLPGAYKNLLTPLPSESKIEVA
ncbi:response regulator [Pseudobacteriovorax antillogorgiicola]|uniref:CheY chemotaxis protein or a CheY-like REC (Receiver) domain n=1 Tax=Pseudobacteriovorax antillogorgiicola TaxID=1513793 RepID=A0A1Y6CAP0_9BACT|nr:response regulator [Pseudobacteriovorax antillogorgiicola]TCS49089.1 CheY-like chemotaxis protein [Pseudobacteriovorax antillogorgiicola]SMF51840.1 CheY chemotaxis protein or a CheY-like REC (receiver) domain [Pseudobacteriovorax antillogorgiicola]